MASSPASPAGSDALRVTVPAGADVEDIPWLMALEFLEGQGYAIETLSFADTAIEIAAMAQGDLQPESSIILGGDRQGGSALHVHGQVRQCSDDGDE
jgi:hypothetical protein